MQQKETNFKKIFLKYMQQKYGPLIWLKKFQEVGRRGIPDCIGCVNGKFFAVELKTDEGRLDPLQSVTLNEIRESGGKVWILRPANFNNFKKEFEDFISI